MSESKCLVCGIAKNDKGRLRGVCTSCQLNVFVQAHIDHVCTEISRRAGAKEIELREREAKIKINEQGIKLIEFLREVIQ